MSNRPEQLELADYVRDLTRWHTHREPYRTRQGTTWASHAHLTSVPPLLVQLWGNNTASAVAEDGPRPGFGSKPAARLDALDTAMRIDLYAEQWIHKLGKTPHSADTITMIRQLHGLAASQPPTVRRAIEADVRRWWIWARVVTGWDAPAWTPDVTCPSCGIRGKVKVRLIDQYAACVNDACRATWGETTLGLLAEHIRSESEERKPAQDKPATCSIPWPAPEVPDLSRMCPRCGSARCHRALALRLLDTLRKQQIDA